MSTNALPMPPTCGTCGQTYTLAVGLPAFASFTGDGAGVFVVLSADTDELSDFEAENLVCDCSHASRAAVTDEAMDAMRVLAEAAGYRYALTVDGDL